MSLEHTRAANAQLDRAAVDAAETILRNALLQGLSEIRGLKFSDQTLRDGLIDEVSKYFHPDGQSDAFSDAFFDVRALADRNVEDAADELSLSQRRAGMRVAAE